MELFPNLLFIHYGFAASLNCVNDKSKAQERMSLIESTFFGLTDSQVPSTIFTAFFLAQIEPCATSCCLQLGEWAFAETLGIFRSMNELEDRSHRSVG
jgi:hypothetical protein